MYFFSVGIRSLGGSLAVSAFIMYFSGHPLLNNFIVTEGVQHMCMGMCVETDPVGILISCMIGTSGTIAVTHGAFCIGLLANIQYMSVYSTTYWLKIWFVSYFSTYF